MILGVNIDHVATLRQARGGIEPDPIMAAPLAILGGADGITVHLREDRRHIQDRDLKLLRQFVPVELNLEMAATKEMFDIALEIKPDMITLVPEKRQELTTEGGLNLKSNRRELQDAIDTLQQQDMPVSLFINPKLEDIVIASELGARMIELHTGYYSLSRKHEREIELLRIKQAVEAAEEQALLINAGHGLDYYNVQAIASIKAIRGLYIGHSIIARSIFTGLQAAVRDMKLLIDNVP